MNLPKTENLWKSFITANPSNVSVYRNVQSYKSTACDNMPLSKRLRLRLLKPLETNQAAVWKSFTKLVGHWKAPFWLLSARVVRMTSFLLPPNHKYLLASIYFPSAYHFSKIRVWPTFMNIFNYLTWKQQCLIKINKILWRLKVILVSLIMVHRKHF